MESLFAEAAGVMRVRAFDNIRTGSDSTVSWMNTPLLKAVRRLR
jgi:hypothetical protein